MDLSAIKSTLQEVVRRFLASPHSKVELPTGRKVRVGLLDGTCWGPYPGSVLSLLGEGVSDQVAHYRISPGKGHERATSRAVEETACRRFGEGYIDYLAKDALYMTKSDIKRARKTGYDLVVKTEDNSLDIFKKARTAFYYRLKRTPMDLKEVEGVDAERGCKYKITCTAELTWQKQALKVAHINETYFNPKPGHPEQTDYWVLTTDLEMDPHDMREVKILRWNIENRTFRLLSRLTESKHKITEDEHTRKVLLGLWFIGVNLFGRVRTWLREPQMKKIHQTTRRTWKWHTKQFIRQVHRAAYRHRNRKTG